MIGQVKTPSSSLSSDTTKSILTVTGVTAGAAISVLALWYYFPKIVDWFNSSNLPAQGNTPPQTGIDSKSSGSASPKILATSPNPLASLPPFSELVKLTSTPSPVLPSSLESTESKKAEQPAAPLISENTVSSCLPETQAAPPKVSDTDFKEFTGLLTGTITPTKSTKINTFLEKNINLLSEEQIIVILKQGLEKIPENHQLSILEKIKERLPAIVDDLINEKAISTLQILLDKNMIEEAFAQSRFPINATKLLSAHVNDGASLRKLIEKSAPYLDVKNPFHIENASRLKEFLHMKIKQHSFNQETRQNLLWSFPEFFAELSHSNLSLFCKVESNEELLAFCTKSIDSLSAEDSGPILYKLFLKAFDYTAKPNKITDRGLFIEISKLFDGNHPKIINALAVVCRIQMAYVGLPFMMFGLADVLGLNVEEQISFTTNMKNVLCVKTGREVDDFLKKETLSYGDNRTVPFMLGWVYYLTMNYDKPEFKNKPS